MLPSSPEDKVKVPCDETAIDTNFCKSGSSCTTEKAKLTLRLHGNLKRCHWNTNDTNFWWQRYSCIPIGSRRCSFSQCKRKNLFFTQFILILPVTSCHHPHAVLWFAHCHSLLFSGWRISHTCFCLSRGQAHVDSSSPPWNILQEGNKFQNMQSAADAICKAV